MFLVTATLTEDGKKDCTVVLSCVYQSDTVYNCCRKPNPHPSAICYAHLLCCSSPRPP